MTYIDVHPLSSCICYNFHNSHCTFNASLPTSNFHNLSHPTSQIAKRTAGEIRNHWRKLRSNLEPMNEQISNITKLLHQLVNDNAAKSTPTTGSRTNHSRTKSSPDTRLRVEKLQLALWVRIDWYTRHICCGKSTNLKIFMSSIKTISWTLCWHLK